MTRATVVAALLVGVAAGGGGQDTRTAEGDRVRVPNVVGRYPIDAKCLLERRRLRWSYGGRRSRPSLDSCAAAEGEPRLDESVRVVRQRPGAGRIVRRGTVVVLATCGGQNCA